MSWFNAFKSAGSAMRNELDSMLTAAEERTPNLDSAPGWFSSGRELAEGAVDPRSLSQGDAVVAVEARSGEYEPETLTGTVFSVDKRNELVVIIPADVGGMETVLFSEANFYYQDNADGAGNGQAGRVRDPNRPQMRREDMEEGVIYDAEIID